VSESTKLRELTALELVAEQLSGTLILDTRPAQQFAAIHIRGSIQISWLVISPAGPRSCLMQQRSCFWLPKMLIPLKKPTTD